MTEEENLALKICILGDSAVGKTSLIRKYTYDIFNDQYITTMGTKVTKKNISIDMPKYNKKFNITFSIHDIMGDANLLGILNQSHFQGMNGAFLVCDATRPKTLENLIFWLDSLFKEGPKNISLLCVANKSDLTGGHMFDIGDIPGLEEIFGAPWMLTSAKTGDNIEEAFRILGKKMIKEYIKKTEPHLFSKAEKQ
ncbi:MAG: GTP-binding protein [Thermoplasmata archaeon]|nr:MAG: GTP-binding protein [Thermoplasmata archaeon]